MNTGANVVLVCIGNFQEYILNNVEQLIRLGHTHIYVITDPKFYPFFESYKNNIVLVDVTSLQDSYEYYSKSSLNKDFRNGFWALASLRLFYIYQFMKQYTIKNVIHLENDVLVYHHCDTILNCFDSLDSLDSQYVYIPFDSYQRNIASIMYIPSSAIFKNILDCYDFNKDDMNNFSTIQRERGFIRNFPIFPTLKINPEFEFVTQNYDLFKGFIFDAAAIGQYLGGVDPRNIPGDSRGFVNESCVIKYNSYHFDWIQVECIKKPFLILNDGAQIPIFNLHIHCKKLSDFM
jgi:hypothetical protein